MLLVKAEQRGQLPGIIHGSSGSGASLFVEPMPAVELNNDIVALGEDERREVARILHELTAQVGEHADDPRASAQLLGELDAVQARALLARADGRRRPWIVDELRLELREARHPLLSRRPVRAARPAASLESRDRAGDLAVGSSRRCWW